MKEYIEREAALKQSITVRHYDGRIGGVCDHQYVRVEDIKSIPAADVEPVVHAAWKKVYATTPPTLFECTACGKRELYADGDMEYCPHCGARMDGDAHG